MIPLEMGGYEIGGSESVGPHTTSILLRVCAPRDIAPVSWPAAGHPADPSTLEYSETVDDGHVRGTCHVWAAPRFNAEVNGEPWAEAEEWYPNFVHVDVELGDVAVWDDEAQRTTMIASIKSAIRQMRGGRDIVELLVHENTTPLLEEDLT